MDVTAESILSVFEERDRIGGLRMVYEPKYLRFFQARFTPVAAVPHETACLQSRFSGRAEPSVSE